MLYPTLFDTNELWSFDKWCEKNNLVKIKYPHWYNPRKYFSDMSHPWIQYKGKPLERYLVNFQVYSKYAAYCLRWQEHVATKFENMSELTEGYINEPKTVYEMMEKFGGKVLKLNSNNSLDSIDCLNGLLTKSFLEINKSVKPLFSVRELYRKNQAIQKRCCYEHGKSTFIYRKNAIIKANEVFLQCMNNEKPNFHGVNVYKHYTFDSIYTRTIYDK